MLGESGLHYQILTASHHCANENMQDCRLNFNHVLVREVKHYVFSYCLIPSIHLSMPCYIIFILYLLRSTGTITEQSTQALRINNRALSGS